MASEVGELRLRSRESVTTRFDFLDSHFTNAIAKDVADLSASEQHCSPTSRSFDIGSKC
jgi:hypothetical protein